MDMYCLALSPDGIMQLVLQAMQREGMRESFGSDSDVSISASDEGDPSLSRRSSGKRVGSMLNYANRGMSTSISAVGRGITGTMQAVRVSNLYALFSHYFYV